MLWNQEHVRQGQSVETICIDACMLFPGTSLL